MSRFRLSRRVAPWALLVATVFGTGCFEPVEGGPPAGYEADLFSCTDRRDNDFDGLVDCVDPDCIARNFCGLIVIDDARAVPENTFERCTDRIDNDLDGNFDCGDRNCQPILELCCVTEFSDALCADRRDNDGNGFADCMDFSCRGNPFIRVCSTETDCADGLDNDGDRDIDCNDRDCASSIECGLVMGSEDTVERCMDGFDNDGNGFSDCGDFSCCGNRSCTAAIDPAIQTYCMAIQENTVERCTDGIDNDDNGFQDCAEFGCCPRGMPCIDPAIQTFCDAMPEEETLELCTDGIDNDGDGFTDCDDFSCSASLDPALRNICEASFESCINGLDDDGDEFADCADFSCRDVLESVTFTRPDGSTSTFITSPCNESVSVPDDFVDGIEESRAVAQALERCTDGFDGDGDGFVDCDDWDCQWNPLLNPRARDLSNDNPGLCQGGFFDAGALAWRRPMGAEVPRIPSPIPLLCR